MKIFMNKSNNGFAAFILVITISSLFIAFSFIQSTEYGHYFDEVQNKEYRLIAYYNAYSCIDQALLVLSHDYFFTTDKKIQIIELNCSIISVFDSNGQKMILVSGKYKKVVEYRQAIARLYDDHLEIVSIQ